MNEWPQIAVVLMVAVCCPCTLQLCARTALVQQHVVILPQQTLEWRLHLATVLYIPSQLSSIPTTTPPLRASLSLLRQGVLLSMVTSIDGFRIREHFVSYGYGFSVAFQVRLGVGSCCFPRLERC